MRRIVMFVLFLGAGAGPVSAGGEEVPAGLKEEAERVLKLAKPQARSRIGTALRYAAVLHKAGFAKEASRAVDRIIKLHNGALEAHLLAAELLAESGKSDAAKKKATWVLERAETDAIRGGALRLLGRPADTSIPEMARLDGADMRIVVVPIGSVDALLLKAVAGEVMRHLPFPVVIQDARLEMPPATRNPFQGELRRLRDAFRNQIETETAQAALAELSKRPDELESDRVFLEVYRAWLCRTARWRELSDLEARLGAEHRPEWRAEDLTRHLASVVGLHARDKLVFVGVTRGAMFASGMRRGPRERAVFGWGGKGLGVASYAGFRAASTGAAPDWKRLVARTAKQVMCVAGSTFEIRRCRDRKCPMRVLFDLGGLDSKGLDPCPECARQLRQHF
jgi:predicted Zn-dependent protease/nucleotide-binding universal stress UspA family protein